MSDDRISECKSCGAEIRWMKTRNDKNICVDVPAVEDPHREEILSATLYDKTWMHTHFETCPQAGEHRKPRGEDPKTTAGDSGVIAKKLTIAVAVLTDLASAAPDGMRAQTLAKTALSQIRGVR